MSYRPDMSTTDESSSEARIRRTIVQYFASTRNGDREGWIACFTPDAVSRDPVNAPAITGHDALRRFYDGIVGLVATIGLEAEQVYVCGDHAAITWVGRGLSKSGKPYVFQGIDVFEFAADGRISAAKAYWDPSKLMAQLG